MYQRTCPRCESEFSTDNYRQKYCKKNCSRPSREANHARDTLTRNNGYVFIAVDGEGVDRPNGDHDYIMLSVGDATLTNPDGSALHHSQIFAFLYEQYMAHPNAVFVGFSLGYDFTMWTKSLSEHSARMLYTREGVNSRRRDNGPEPYPVYVDGKWEIDILGNKRFRLCPHIHRGPSGISQDRAYDHCVCGDPLPYPDLADVEHSIGDELDVTGKVWDRICSKPKRERMYICDTFGYWQTSFLNAIAPSGWAGAAVVTENEYSILAAGKARRSEYTVPYGETGYFTEMAEYNRTENECLSRITATLAAGFADIGLSINRKDWYGPGRVAQAWLNTLNVTNDSHISIGNVLSREYHQSVLKDWQYEIGWQSYYGGRFEQPVHGHIPGTVSEYDINSAYPAVIAELPCLLHGKWHRGEEIPYYELSRFHGITCVYGTAVGSNAYLGALPHRTRTGAIVFPSITRGWYWVDEINAGIRAGLIDTFDVESWVHYEPCDCEPPLRSIRELYSGRVHIGKNTPRGKSLKLVYNSAYGKFAQSIGNPRYGNGIYASLITSGCRTQILDAIATHPKGASAVTMIATDGLYFTSPHPGLDITKDKLGAWEEKQLTGMTQFMPGVYWTDDSRQRIREKKELKFKSRGISARDLAKSIEAIDEQFGCFPEHADWPRMEVNVQFCIVSCKQALSRNAWDVAGHVSHNDSRSIDSRPVHKRNPTSVYRDGHGYIRTEIGIPERTETAPYDKRFGYDNPRIGDFREEGWGITADGDVTDLFWESFGHG